MTGLNIIIVGGGLGGLTAALALAKSGHKVAVYDAAPAFGEAGAGIRVPPNSSRLLTRLGVNFDKIKKSKSSRCRLHLR
jgi:salicylate hydroxylase